MAAYPDLPLSRDSRKQAANGTAVDILIGGEVRARDLHADTVYEFTLIHPMITFEQGQAVEAFYEVNRSADIEFVYKKDSESYAVNFSGPPEVDRVRGPYWEARVSLIGKRV